MSLENRHKIHLEPWTKYVMFPLEPCVAAMGVGSQQNTSVIVKVTPGITLL